MNERDEVINSMKQLLRTEKMSGLEDICVERRPQEMPKKKTAESDIHALEAEVLKCRKCQLASTRQNVVFGEGNPKADLMFVGEAPGADEDAQGRPFVGRAGQLLTRIIEAMGLKREDVFIANILKCRPPGNRNPLPSEIALCRKHLERQIDLIRPRVICALGKFSAQTLLDTGTPISRLRGVFKDYRGIKLMSTYHPAYLLRNPSGKKEVWEDMQKVAEELGITVPEMKNKGKG